MNIVITMAGLGSRFKKVGYKLPKYEINIKGKSLFYWSLYSLSNITSSINKYFFIVREEDKSADFINNECSALGITNYEIIMINHLTDGQATSVLFAKPYWDSLEPLLIYNIDTFIEPAHFSMPQDIMDGWIPCFKGEGDKWSFVKLDANGIAAEVREKKRISENASVGLYWFSSANLYVNAYEQYFSIEGREEKGERYIAPLYNQLIKEGLKVCISTIPIEAVHILGTPEDLEYFKNVKLS